jgi:hypothetical protein
VKNFTQKYYKLLQLRTLPPKDLQKNNLQLFLTQKIDVIRLTVHLTKINSPQKISTHLAAPQQQAMFFDKQLVRGSS